VRALRLSAIQTAVRHAVAVLSISYVTVASFPAAYYVLRPGLDISWVYGLNSFFNSQFRFGRDINFTLGPLGVLLYPANFGHDVIFAILFRVVIALSFVIALAAVAWGRALGLALFAAGYGIALGLGQTPEFHLSVVAAVAAIAAIEKRSLPALIALAVISAPLWLAKFTVGLAATTVVVGFAWAWRSLSRGRVSASVLIVLAHLASLLCAGWIVVGSLSDFVLWLRASLELAGGYSVAMSFDPGWTDQRKGVAVCALFLVACIAFYRLRRSAALPLILLAGSLFLAYKAGFVREDAHVKSFFGFAVAALAVPFLTAISAKERMVSAAGLLLIAGLAVRAQLKRHYLDPRAVAHIVTGELGIDGIRKAFHWRDTEVWLDRATEQSIVDGRVPEEVRRVIGTGTVVITPWELVVCLANQFACVPLATLQEYSAYTPYLDSITAAQFEAPLRPDFVLVHTLKSTDGRHIVLDGPLTWRSLIDQYEPMRLQTTEAALLRRRATPMTGQLLPLPSMGIRSEEWVPVPRVTDFTFAEIKTELNWLGQVVKLLHRIPAAFIELRRTSGAVERRRLILETAVNGILVQPFASDVGDLPAVLNGAEGDRVVALRLTGRGLRYYRKEMKLRWLVRNAQSSAAADR
jgi:hypothetical protein